MQYYFKTSMVMQMQRLIKNKDIIRITGVPLIKSTSRDFPGDPVVKTLYSQCRRHGFDRWSGS